MSLIRVKDVSKQFHIYKRDKRWMGSIRSLFRREYTIKHAVNQISFDIEKGELVGYIGPNGAGKSTTIKMLSGILQPTSGVITVDGIVPHEDRKRNAMRMGVVFGQRSQLYWDLPMEDTFDLFKKMYRIDEARYRRNVEFYVELLGMQEFLSRPVRQLSLGQKMRANLAVALLHDPDIVYLDEPTIGLDIIAKSRIRRFIKEINKEKQTTVILTTHDMDDIEEICNRIIMIDKGTVIYDGALPAFKRQFSDGHFLIVDLEHPDRFALEDERLSLYKDEGERKWILFSKDRIGVTEAIHLVTQNNRIKDLQLKEPDIEEVVKEMYERR